MDVIYIGPSCPSCANNEYTKIPIGPTPIYWKQCTECPRMSPIEDGELTEKPVE